MNWSKFDRIRCASSSFCAVSFTHSEIHLIIEKCLQVGFTSINASSILRSHHQNQINRINLSSHRYRTFCHTWRIEIAAAKQNLCGRTKGMKARVWLSSASYYHLIVSIPKSDSDARSSTHQGGLKLKQFQLKSTNESNKLHELFSKGFADFNPSFSTSWAHNRSVGALMSFPSAA